MQVRRWETYRPAAYAAYSIFVCVFRGISQENIRLGKLAI